MYENFHHLPMLPGTVGPTPTIVEKETREFREAPTESTIRIEHQEAVSTETFTFPRVLFPEVSDEQPEIATPPFVEAKQAPEAIVIPPFQETEPVELIMPTGFVQETREAIVATREAIEAARERIETVEAELRKPVVEAPVVEAVVETPTIEVPADPFEGWTKKQLYARAKELKIPNRSKMTKAKLHQALLERYSEA